jgi:hypothetical protein
MGELYFKSHLQKAVQYCDSQTTYTPLKKVVQRPSCRPWVIWSWIGEQVVTGYTPLMVDRMAFISLTEAVRADFTEEQDALFR